MTSDYVRQPMQRQMTFKPSRFVNNLACGVGLILSSVFVLTGIACFVAVGPRLFSFAFAALGTAGVAACLGAAFVRVIVSDEGIYKLPKISGGFRLRWQDVESWEHLPLADYPCVRIRVIGGRYSKDVYGFEVEQPGMDVFLLELRDHAGQREVAASRAK